MSDALDRAFQELQLEYLAALPQRVMELRSDLAARRAGDEAAVASLKARLHRLAGSGGSYGFTQLSSLAREAERWLAGHATGTGMDELESILERMVRVAQEAEAELKRGSGAGGN